MGIAGLQVFEADDLLIEVFTHRGEGTLLERLQLHLRKLLRLAEHRGQELVTDGFVFDGAGGITGSEFGACEGGIGGEIATLMVDGDADGRGGQEA